MCQVNKWIKSKNGMIKLKRVTY